MWELGTELGTSWGMLLTAEPSPQFLSTAFLTDFGQHHFLLQRRDIRLGDFNFGKSHFQSSLSLVKVLDCGTAQ